MHKILRALTPTAPMATRQPETFNFTSKVGSTLKGKNLLLEEHILPFKSLNPIKKDKNETGRVASLESVFIHLKYLG